MKDEWGPADNTLLIEQLRGLVALLKKEEGLKRMQAQQQAAQQHGYSRWSSMIEDLEAGEWLVEGPLSRLSGWTRQTVYRFWKEMFREARRAGKIVYAYDDKPYAGDLVEDFNLDVLEWFKERDPQLAALFPHILEQVAVEIETHDGPYVLTETMSRLYGADDHDEVADLL
ncbi:hypothetical protein [Microvirga sesbaniae]|uniref:hypothetical protein n=1 Tax=Microvirga sesbaniae TaxID=681392 RepID=UPI0021C97699|nr:hypothetical protein [Microvirga sp. HBU67692]